MLYKLVFLRFVTMKLCEIAVFSASGQLILQKQYRSDVKNGARDVFSKKIRDEKSSLTPYFVENDLHYYHIKRNGLYILGIVPTEIMPVIVIEFLTRLFNLCKDFCGTVNEESLKSNIVMVHEILDEILDHGFVQLTSTDKLKAYIQSDPIPYKSPEHSSPGLFGIEHKAAPSDASNKPVIQPRLEKEMRKNEIFVDVIEKMNVLIGSNGNILRCDINGKVNMKSFLTSMSDIKVGLSEDLTIGKSDREKGYGSVVNLQECGFHECVKLDAFDSQKIVTIRPPQGEFSMMTYHLSGDLPHSLPFRVYSYVKDGQTPHDLEVGLKLRCEIPSSCKAMNVKVHIMVPKCTSSVSQQMSGPGQTFQFIESEKKVFWTIKKITGKSEVSTHLKLLSAKQSKNSLLELGPVALDFEVSGYVCSGLQIRFIRVCERGQSYVPIRWLRYISVSDSYLVKI